MSSLEWLCCFSWINQPCAPSCSASYQLFSSSLGAENLNIAEVLIQSLHCLQLISPISFVFQTCLETYHQWKHYLIIYVLCFSTVQHLQDQGHSQEFPIGLGNSLVQAQECGESAVKCSKGFSPQSTRVSVGTRDLGQSFHVVSDHGPWLVALIELLLLPLLHCTCSL